MKLRKVLFLAVISVVISAGIASALSLGEINSKILPKASESLPEDSFIVRPEESVYFVLKLDDTASFLKWLASDENINLFMPLILKSEDSNDIIGGIEFFRAFATKTPLKSAAIIFGMNDPDTKKPPFFQMAFTVDSSMAGTVKKVSDGTAEDSDFSKLILGNDNPINAIAQTMIKAEKLKDGGYRLDNELFVKAEGETLILATTLDELAEGLSAFNGGEARLFSSVKRNFTEKDFAFVHVDYKTLDKIDTNHDLDSADKLVTELFDKPINFEFAFESKPDKFIFSLAVNLIEAINQKYAAKMEAPTKSMKGSYLKLAGTKSPLVAFGGVMNLSALKDSKETKDGFNEFARQMRVRFGVSEEEIDGFFKGPFSLTVNDSVTFESFKFPALYVSQTGEKGVAAKIFAKFTKSPHFQKVQDGILQLDTSISPVSCLIQDKGEELGINFAELASLNGKPSVKPALQSLLDAEGISAMWIDFDGIRSWILDDENGVMATAVPMGKMFGLGDLVDAVNEILTAEYSVPSFSFRAESAEKK